MEKYSKNFYNDVLQCLREIRLGNKTYADMEQVFQQYNFDTLKTRDSLRRAFKMLNIFDDFGCISVPKDITYKETTGIESNGNLVSDKLIELSDMDKNNPELILKAHGFNPKNFELVSCRNSIWNTNSKVNKNFYSSKVTVKPVKNPLDFDYLDKYFSEKVFNNERKINYKNYTKQYQKDAEILEIDIADLHAGLLSYNLETGENYDINIAKKYFEDSIDDIIERCKGRKFQKIILVNLGDFLHVNNSEGTTAKGTKQDVDSRLSKIFTMALDMLIETVDKLEKITKIEVVSVSGNHDRDVSTFLFTALEKAFRKDKNVSFNIGPNPLKAKRYGKVLLGWTHGDMKKENITSWLQSQYSNDYGESKYREIHAGHWHSQGIIDKSGIIVRYLSKMCPASFWEHSQGYNAAVKTITAFIWNENKGLREIWFNNIENEEND